MTLPHYKEKLNFWRDDSGFQMLQGPSCGKEKVTLLGEIIQKNLLPTSSALVVAKSCVFPAQLIFIHCRPHNKNNFAVRDELFKVQINH